MYTTSIHPADHHLLNCGSGLYTMTCLRPTNVLRAHAKRSLAVSKLCLVMHMCRSRWTTAVQRVRTKRRRASIHAARNPQDHPTNLRHEEVPQTERSGLGLELGQDRRDFLPSRSCSILDFGHLAREHRLCRNAFIFHKPLQQS